MHSAFKFEIAMGFETLDVFFSLIKWFVIHQRWYHIRVSILMDPYQETDLIHYGMIFDSTMHVSVQFFYEDKCVTI